MTDSTIRPARVVTVCVRGRTAKREKDNTSRIEQIEAVIGNLVAQASWSPVDAVLLPAGYFWLDEPLIIWSEPEQAKRLQSAPFAETCLRLARRLHEWSPGALLAVGIDTDPAHKRLRGDQALVAWNSDGLAALALKAVPVAKEAAGSRGRRLAMRMETYSSQRRFVRLANGEIAALCVCYDAFGLAAMAGGLTSHLNPICLLDDDLRAMPVSRSQRREVVQRWQGLFDQNKPTVALIATHGFDQPGREGYWQRHGISTASAAFGGGLAVASGHFQYALPLTGSQSPLAALAVPQWHLRAGTLRQAHAHRPLDAIWVNVGHQKRRALVRLFEGASLPASACVEAV